MNVPESLWDPCTTEEVKSVLGTPILDHGNQITTPVTSDLQCLERVSSLDLGVEVGVT